MGGIKKKEKASVTFQSEYRQSSEGGMHFALVPAEVKRQFAERGSARVVATIGNLEPFQCGLMPYRNGDGYLIINKARQ